MKRRVALSVAVLLVAGVGGWFLLRSGPPSYPSFRQAREQTVPGTFGLVLSPPPSGFDPRVTPLRAVRVALGSVPSGGVSESLASVSGRFQPPPDPVWTIVARGRCYATAKGDVLAPSRSDRAGCTDHNLWIEFVDARTGTGLASVSGYDLSGSWSPAVGPA